MFVVGWVGWVVCMLFVPLVCTLALVCEPARLRNSLDYEMFDEQKPRMWLAQLVLL